jgi:GNAT superfamily N-acetyltransferase
MMSHELEITLRRLSENELRLAQEIDVSEEGDTVFRYLNGQLTTEPREWHRPAWDASQWEDKITTWADAHGMDVVMGAFDGATLIGMASLHYGLTEDQAQLVSLHVSRAYRRHGVATRLLHELVRLARQSNAREMYVSANPSESAVGFYTRQGFAPTAHVNQRLYDFEPEDIHMTLTL